MERGAGEEAMKVTGEGEEGEKVGVAEVEEKMEKEELEGLEEEVSQETHRAEEGEEGEVEEGVALHLLSLANPQVGNITHFCTGSQEELVEEERVQKGTGTMETGMCHWLSPRRPWRRQRRR